VGGDEAPCRDNAFSEVSGAGADGDATIAPHTETGRQNAFAADDDEAGSNIVRVNCVGDGVVAGA